MKIATLDIASMGAIEEFTINLNARPEVGASVIKAPVFSKFSEMFEWANITGTLNGVIEVYAVVDDLEAKLFTQVIDSASNVSDPIKIDFSGANEQICNAVKVRIIKTGMTGGDLKFNHIQMN